MVSVSVSDLVCVSVLVIVDCFRSKADDDDDDEFGRQSTVTVSAHRHTHTLTLASTVSHYFVLFLSVCHSFSRSLLNLQFSIYYDVCCGLAASSITFHCLRDRCGAAAEGGCVAGNS